MLQRGYRDQPWHTPYAVVDKVDDDQRLMRRSYRYTGERPQELFSVYSRHVEPVHEKVRDLRLFDRTMLRERIVWLPFGTSPRRVEQSFLHDGWTGRTIDVFVTSTRAEQGLDRR